MKKADEKVISPPDFSVVKPQYVGKWVALSSNYKKLIAVGDTLADVLRKAEGQSDKVVLKVLPNLGYAPNAS